MKGKPLEWHSYRSGIDQVEATAMTSYKDAKRRDPYKDAHCRERACSILCKMKSDIALLQRTTHAMQEQGAMQITSNMKQYIPFPENTKVQ